MLETKPVDLQAVLTLIDSVDPENRRALLYENPYIRMRIVDAFGGESLVQVMSSVLAGETYVPGWESEVYWTLSKEERDAVNGRVDAWFEYETGVSRALDPGNEAEMPLVRHWLRMRDVIVETDLRREIDDDDRRAEREKRFSRYLAEAVTKMNSVGFGSALEVPPVLAPGSKTEIRYWNLVMDEELATEYDRERQGMLVYEGGATPATAVDELFKEETLEKWALDCVEFVQAAHLYARRHTLGYSAFNEAVDASGGVLALRLQNSTGYRATLEYSRSSPSAPMEMRVPGGEAVEVSTDIDELLDRAPVGSRVVWRNVRMEGTDFFNENTVKLGTDSYAAHGFEGRKVFTRAQLERALAELSYEPMDGDFDTYKRENVFLRKIEHVAVP